MKADLPPTSPTWFCIRRNGAAKQEGWIENGASLSALPHRVGASQGDVVEVCVADKFRSVPLERFSRVFYGRARGLVGMEVTLRGAVTRLAPTRMISANLSFRRALEKFLHQQGATIDDFATNGTLRSFSTRQYLLSGDSSVEELVRGGSLVAPLPAPAENRAADLANGIGQWMVRNLTAEGALPYKYWPSQGVESPADNAIRRFLASWGLARLGALLGNAEICQAAQRNLRFNLACYFQPIGDGRGAIVEARGAKLGAAAVAGLAILASPAREEFRAELAMLAAGVNSLADAELGFRMFFFPTERDGENWNFYSGEALLFWAEAMRQGLEDAPSLQRCVAAFEHCRTRHYQARNPAFVPWHTQACSSLFAQTGRREFAEFALEISDWLLPLQQWDGLAPDLRGRFYDPQRPEFGPPHAASTGVYMEGLADAIALARALGDGPRTAAYERAVNRGLRSLRQLQYRDRRDAFYIAKKRRVMGALRVEVYDNTVRVDSAAHALMAATKILQPMKFGAAAKPIAIST